MLLRLPGNSQGRKTVPEGESVVENLAVSVRSCSLRFLWSIRERWAGFSNGAAEAPHRALQPAAGRKAPGPILPLGEFPTLGATGNLDKAVTQLCNHRLFACLPISTDGTCVHNQGSCARAACLSPCRTRACTYVRVVQSVWFQYLTRTVKGLIVLGNLVCHSAIVCP